MTHQRTALITGASRGLGAALATALAADGWRLILTARTAPEPDGHTWIAGDVRDPDHRRALARAAQAAGGVDLLVNNASSLGPTPLPRVTVYPLAALPELFDTNVFAPVALTVALIDGLRERSGAVVNISSDAATGGYEGWSAYGASKAALDQFGNVLGAEEPSIRVWAVDPGEMNTTMLTDAIGAEAAEAPEPREHAVPAILALLERRPDSGRFSASELLAGSST
ncbi:SDR family NAD(P)-dependent oxidoreductase [Stackebrandtia soli]|uniref:SDR family NAD(P)-dependent oxidoreductase n=1 Tax=Stackebrandtia soli TaxID=1892856 RepID=UPI0039EBBB98